MRHGQTDWNVHHKLQGQTDVPLNDTGRQMAAEARKIYKDIPIDICYCSPLSRARETAAIFLAERKIPIISDDRLRELGFGIYEGTEEIFQKPSCPVYKLFKDPLHYEPQDGAESLISLYKRTGEFIKEILNPELTQQKHVLIVGHGAMDCSLINQLEDIPLEHFWERMSGNCELIKLSHTYG
jgi:probable phosphoglycerate mutase